MSDILNPDSTILGQLDEHWQKLAALIIFKLVGHDPVIITTEDMERFNAEFESGDGGRLLTHGHYDAIEFRIVGEEAAERLAAHDLTLGGRA